MDFANRGNRPNSAPQNQAGNQNDQAPMSFQSHHEKPKRVGKWDLNKITSMFMLLAVALIAITLIIGLVFGGNGEQAKESSLIDSSKYQAIFLNSQDGQVYFGKLGVYNRDLYVLTDIYYVRVENPIQPEGAETQQQANISLAKLGNELHGPQDVMYIARDKVLYWENLKDDGQVVTAITEYKANGGNTNQQQTDNSGGAAGTQPEGTDQVNDTPGADTNTP